MVSERGFIGGYERSRSYPDIAGVTADFAIGTPENLAATAMFSQNPAPSKVKKASAKASETRQAQTKDAGQRAAIRKQATKQSDTQEKK